MQSLRQLECFAAVARSGSFVGASKELGLAPSSVAKSVSRLEKTMGARLFNRTTRAVQLTSDGELLLASSAGILEEVDALISLMAPGSDAQGILRISAPVGYGTHKVVPVLTQMLRTYPQLKVDLRLSDERLNIVREGLDIAIRIGELNDSGLSARLIDRQNLILCASPDYIASVGKPLGVEDLDTDKIFTFRMPTSGRERPVELLIDGEVNYFRPRSSFVASHGEALVEAVLQGIGFTQVPEYMVSEHLATGSLVEILPAHRPAALEVHTVVSSAKLMPARVRALIDALVDAFGVT